MKVYKNIKAQTLLEYTLVTGLAVTVLFAMNTMFRRGTQSMVRVVSDQIGEQKKADQQSDPSGRSGHLKTSDITTKQTIGKTTEEDFGTMKYLFDNEVETGSQTVIDLGTRPKPGG